MSLLNKHTFGKKASGSELREYATWNPSDINQYLVLSDGNLTVADSFNRADSHGVRATIAKDSGLWYYEVEMTGISGSYQFGMATSTSPLQSSTVVRGVNYCQTCYINLLTLMAVGYTLYNTNYFQPNVTLLRPDYPNGAPTPMGVLLDCDNRRIGLIGDDGAGGVVQTNWSPTGLLVDEPLFPIMYTYSAGSILCHTNFGETPFAYETEALAAGANLGVYNVL